MIIIIIYLISWFSAYIASRGALKNIRKTALEDYNFAISQTPNFYRSWYINICFSSLLNVLVNKTIDIQNFQDPFSILNLKLFYVIIVFILIFFISDKISNSAETYQDSEKNIIIYFGITVHIIFFVSAYYYFVY